MALSVDELIESPLFHGILDLASEAFTRSPSFERLHEALIQVARLFYGITVADANDPKNHCLPDMLDAVLSKLPTRRARVQTLIDLALVFMSVLEYVCDAELADDASLAQLTDFLRANPSFNDADIVSVAVSTFLSLARQHAASFRSVKRPRRHSPDRHQPPPAATQYHEAMDEDEDEVSEAEADAEAVDNASQPSSSHKAPRPVAPAFGSSTLFASPGQSQSQFQSQSQAQNAQRRLSQSPGASAAAAPATQWQEPRSPVQARRPLSQTQTQARTVQIEETTLRELVKAQVTLSRAHKAVMRLLTQQPELQPALKELLEVWAE